MAVLEADPYADVKERLRTDFPFYAQNFLRIVDSQGKIVPFDLKAEQLRFWEALKVQRDRGEPMRAIVLKARKIGFSTMTQGLIFQRVTMNANHNARTIAHRTDASEVLMGMAEMMYAQLPDHPDLAFLKPPIGNQRKRSEIIFSEPARNQNRRGQVGLNSRIKIDTASEVEAGRSETLHSVHLSEAAFWPDLNRKLTSVLNAVPHDNPDTLVVVESTANGFNAFRDMWLAAESGESEYIPFFSPWFQDPRNQRRLTEDQRAELETVVGSGPWGEDEPLLIELGCSLEQLAWRRWAIVNLSHSDLQKFHQEHPSTPEEAFATTGRHVFSPLLAKEVRSKAEVTDLAAESLVLKTAKTTPKRGRYISVDVPTRFDILRRPEHSRQDLFWKVWQRPEEKGQYIVIVDPASEEEATDGVPDFTGVQVIDHKTGKQVAELQTRAEKDLVAEQVYLICLMFEVRPNRPLLVVEMTGGYGDFIANRVYREYGYKRMYFREPTDPRRREPKSDLVGFSTNRNTKPRLVDGMKELLRERSDGIRSVRLAAEVGTYQRTKAGKTEAAAGAFDDLLMPYMIGQLVRQEVPARPDRSPGTVVDIATRHLRNPKLGY